MAPGSSSTAGQATNLTWRFRLIVEAVAGLRSRTCIIDGEAVACDDAGISSFDRLRRRYHDDCVFLYAFDLIELNGDDLRGVEAKDSTYRSGRSPDWLKMKNAACEAVRREAEEDWGC
jgi:ATP-dependent DNA ligase